MSNGALLTVHEVADLLGLSVGTVYHFVSEKRIPVLKLSARCIRFDSTAIAAWLAEMAVPADSTEHIQPRDRRADDRVSRVRNR